MKHRTAFCSLFFVLFLGCTDDGDMPVASDDDVVNHTGMVQLIGSTYTIHDDFLIYGQHERFVPSNLPSEFKRDSLRVLFSGKRGKIPINARMIGTPLQLSMIRIDFKLLWPIQQLKLTR